MDNNGNECSKVGIEKTKENYSKDNNKNIGNVETSKTEGVLLEVLLPNMPTSLPTLDVDFFVEEPQKRYFLPNVSNRLLARRIYIEILKVIRGYGKIEKITSPEDFSTIDNLKNQMEILSLAILNIYGRLSPQNKVPFFEGGAVNISHSYKKSLQEIYDKVFHIHKLVFKLYEKIDDEQIKNTLLLIYKNLKNQLNTLLQLKQKQ